MFNFYDEFAEYDDEAFGAFIVDLDDYVDWLYEERRFPFMIKLPTVGYAGGHTSGFT